MTEVLTAEQFDDAVYGMVNPDGSFTVSHSVRDVMGEFVPSTWSLRERAEIASRLLRQEAVVDWQPGDSSRYVIKGVKVLANDFYLMFLNGTTGVLQVTEAVDVNDYVLSTAPHGGWQGLRPLLDVMTGRIFKVGVSLADPRHEAEARAHYHRAQPYGDKDANLGRQIRLMVQAGA